MDGDRLITLYQNISKHSGYQVLNDELKSIVDSDKLVTVSRYEKERKDYIWSKLDFEGKRIADIGGNTGFFTFECIKAGASSVDYYEGTQEHAEFVKIASEIYDKVRINVHNDYYLFDERKEKYDIAICLNVVHHLGDDFSNANNIRDAKEKMMFCINQLAKDYTILVFQMGFNWKGNKDCPLFEHGTKNEMITYIEQGTKRYWNVLDIGIAEGKRYNITYKDLNDNNQERDDSLGEFLNRPIFIMKSKLMP